MHTKGQQAHGVLVVNKPNGPTSARCLTTLKRLGQKKIGHAGTLDPMATGVLLILLGHATKISGYLMGHGEKIYKGTLRIGQQTDTWDTEGAIVATSDWEHITQAQVTEAMHAWQGTLMQDVPPYSAAKHEGKALYALARAGKETPKKVKNVEISRVEVLNIDLPYATFRVTCSSGTYIRSLAHSLGMRLGCGAVLTELTREYSHPFGLEVAHTLEDINASPECLHQWVIPLHKALPHWSLLTLTADEEARMRNGNPIEYRPATAQELPGLLDHAILLSQESEPLALAKKERVRGILSWTILRGLWSSAS